MDPVKLRYHGWKKALVAPFERWLFRRASLVIATEEAEVDWVTSFVGSPQNIRLISLAALSQNPVNPVKTSLPEIKQSNNSNNQTIHFLYIGRLTPLKGVRYLLQALPRSAKLTVIGKDEGELRPCQKIARERGLDVDFRGIVSEEEKEQAYAECDVLVLPTLSENFGLVVAEALERGKRVITTDGAPAWDERAVSGQRLAISDGGAENYQLPSTNYQLTYLRGFRDGDDETRVRLLRETLKCLID